MSRSSRNLWAGTRVVVVTVLAWIAGPVVPAAADEADGTSPTEPVLRAAESTPTPEPLPPCEGKFSCAGAGEPIEIVKNVLISPGETSSFVFELVASYGGRPVSIPVTAIRGARPGPTLLLTATIHGDEMNGLPVLLRLRERLDPAALNGMVVMLPVVNPFGFERQTRYLPDRRDLNRYFPGNPRGSLANRIAYRIFQTFVLPSDYLVDFHTAAEGRSNAPHVRVAPDALNARKLAKGYGGMIVLHEGSEGTLRHAANEAEVPTIVYEAGESSRVDPEAVEFGVRGIENLLRSLGMLEGGPGPNGSRPLLMTYSSWLRADTGGVVEMAVELGDLVQANQLLLTIRDTLGGRRTELRSPEPGIVMAMARSAVAQPGNALIRLGLIGENGATHDGDESKADEDEKEDGGPKRKDATTGDDEVPEEE